MAPRAYWTGNVKISLVSFGVRLYNAVSEAEKIRLNQVHKGCNQRIKMPTTCPIHGQVDRADITKARTLLGWEPRVSLDEGLQHTIAYFRSHLGT